MRVQGLKKAVLSSLRSKQFNRSCHSQNMDEWNCLTVSRDELQISTVLNCGQSFRWKLSESDSSAWIGVFSHVVWILKQTDNEILFKTFPSTNGSDYYSALLWKYFQLDVSIVKLYKEWASKDERFAKLTVQDYQGIRMLSQDCVENVFSFICSSNNNISRISQMVEKLCLFYGSEIGTVEGKTYFDFPEVDKLTGSDVEKKLREEKFGYRAGFIAKTASSIVQNGGEEWLHHLKTVGYDDARKKLQTLPGIGKKVADCICLMSLGYAQAIPVDTHIHQIAKKYLPHISKVKTLTDKTYEEITEYFRTLHGGYAGWAQTVLFTSNLRQHKPEAKTDVKSKELIVSIMCSQKEMTNKTDTNISSAIIPGSKSSKRVKIVKQEPAKNDLRTSKRKKV